MMLAQKGTCTMQWTKGSDLPQSLQRQALARYVHRYTGDHIPSWVQRQYQSEGHRPPLHFASDSEWLANTLFPVTAKGALAEKPSHCDSRPTWPNNPEFRDTPGNRFPRTGVPHACDTEDILKPTEEA